MFKFGTEFKYDVPVQMKHNTTAGQGARKNVLPSSEAVKQSHRLTQESESHGITIGIYYFYLSVLSLYCHS